MMNEFEQQMSHDLFILARSKTHERASRTVNKNSFSFWIPYRFL